MRVIPSHLICSFVKLYHAYEPFLVFSFAAAPSAPQTRMEVDANGICGTQGTVKLGVNMGDTLQQIGGGRNRFLGVSLRAGLYGTALRSGPDGLNRCDPMTPRCVRPHVSNFYLTKGSLLNHPTRRIVLPLLDRLPFHIADESL
jgi:hypothetical protein